MAKRTCSIEGCDRPPKARWLCNLHYLRWRKGADVDAPPMPREREVCVEIDCLRPHYARGWCKQHYRRWQEGYDLSKPIRDIKPRGADPVEWFWKGFARVESGCMEWQRGLHATGYGACSQDVGSGSGFAHREAWVLTRGPILDGLWVLHACDNPPCGELTHLWLGTQADNMRDMAEKGRAARARAKLNESQVRDVRARLSSGESQNIVARRFGVTRSTIASIARGETWKNVV